MVPRDGISIYHTKRTGIEDTHRWRRHLSKLTDVQTMTIERIKRKRYTANIYIYFFFEKESEEPPPTLKRRKPLADTYLHLNSYDGIKSSRLFCICVETFQLSHTILDSGIPADATTAFIQTYKSIIPTNLL